MHRIANCLLCLICALSLGLTGLGGAGPAKGATLVELCADSSLRVVWLDAEGSPVVPGKCQAKCLDCLLFPATLVDAVDGHVMFQPMPVPAGLSLAEPPFVHPIAHFLPVSRGPPGMPVDDKRLGGLRPVLWSQKIRRQDSL